MYNTEQLDACAKVSSCIVLHYCILYAYLLGVQLADYSLLMYVLGVQLADYSLLKTLKVLDLR